MTPLTHRNVAGSLTRCLNAKTPIDSNPMSTLYFLSCEIIWQPVSSPQQKSILFGSHTRKEDLTSTVTQLMQVLILVSYIHCKFIFLMVHYITVIYVLIHPNTLALKYISYQAYKKTSKSHRRQMHKYLRLLWQWFFKSGLSLNISN